MSNGDWVPGDLQAIHRVAGTWKGFVRYRDGTNAAHFRWFAQAQVREDLEES